MAATVTLDRIDRTPNGGFLISYSDSFTTEQEDVTGLANYASAGADSDADLCRRALVRYWLHRDPSALDDNVIEGKTATYDPAQFEAILRIY